MKNKRVIVPIDLSNTSFDNLVLARQMADESPVFITLLNVVNLNIMIFEQRLYRELQAETEDALRKIAKHVLGDTQPVKIAVRFGKPCRQIVAEAESSLSELVILSSPNRPRWKRLLGDRTVKSVVRLSPCPTLVLSCHSKPTLERYRKTVDYAPFIYSPNSCAAG